MSEQAASWDMMDCTKQNGNNMANAKQVLDVHVSKGITVAQSNEHMRNWTEKGWKRATDLGNYDPTREHLNFEVVSGGKIRPIDKGRSIPERMAELLHKRGIKDPNEGLEEPRFRTVVNIIFGGSRTRMQELAFGKQEVDFEKGADNRHIKRKSEIERWAKDVYSFVCGRYGEQNIAAFIVHLDELNPHVHCTLLPIKDGKFAYKEIFAGKDKYEFSERMKQLHTDFYAEVNSKWGMSRGSSVSETGKKHRSTEEYRRMLSEECSTIEENISRHQQVLSSLHSDIRMAERRVKGLTSMVENLKKEQAEKEAQLSALKNDMEARKGDAQTLSAEKEKLENELAAIQNKLADKQEKLQTADRQLSELKENMDAIQERTEELKEEAYKYSRDVHSKVDSLLKDAMLENMVNEQDFTILSMYHSQVSKQDPIFDFVVAHFNEYAQIVGKEQVSGYLIGLNNSYIIQLCKKGDLAYKDRLGRVNRDLKEVYSGITFGSLSVLDAITLLSDATYYLYKQDERKFFENMDKYLAGMGDKAELEDYTQSLEDLSVAYNGNLSKTAYTKSIVWITKALEKEMSPQLRTRLLMMMGQCFQSIDNKEKAKQAYNQAFLVSAEISDKMQMKQIQETIQQCLLGL